MVQKIANWIGLGPLSMIGAGLSFSLMAVLVKAASQSIPLFQVTLFRAGVSAVIIFSAMLLQGISTKGENQKILLVRSLSGFVAMCLNFYALSQIQLGDAAVLHQTTPFWVMLLSAFFLKEKFHPSLLALTLLCFAGIAVVLRPSGGIFNFGGMAATTSAIFAAGAYVSVRHLHKTDTFWAMAFYFMATSAVLSFPFMITTWVNPRPLEWAMLIGTGLFGTLGQLWMTYAYKHDEASFVAPFAYAGVLFSFLWGLWFFDEIPGLLTLVGAALTVGGGVGILLLKKNISVPIPPALPDTAPPRPGEEDPQA
ncbi:MAG: DMT family transporter [bacterium]|nr:DMT family transporter [bacterium]